MEDSFEYQIYIGCSDSQLHEQLIDGDELKEMISRFFARNEMDFSLLTLKGGYLHEDGWYDTEDSLCISIIGDQGLDIVRIARNLCAFMNQQCFLIVRSPVKMEFC